MPQIPCPSLPADTARAAASVFGRDHAYIQAGDALSDLWNRLDLSGIELDDSLLAACFYPIALATIFQYWEHLTDRQMSQATRTRMDLKYALHLPMSHPGIAASMLCAFRQHVLESQPGRDALQGLADALSPFASRAKSRPGVMQLVGAVCLSSRAEAVLECIGIALEAVATSNPGWLKANAPAHWYRRYQPRANGPKLPDLPGEIEALMAAVGGDGWHLLEAIESDHGSSLRRLPEIAALRHEWRRQFYRTNGTLRLRPLCDLQYESQFKSMNLTDPGRKEATI